MARLDLTSGNDARFLPFPKKDEQARGQNQKDTDPDLENGDIAKDDKTPDYGQRQANIFKRRDSRRICQPVGLAQAIANDRRIHAQTDKDPNVAVSTMGFDEAIMWSATGAIQNDVLVDCGAVTFTFK